MTTRLWLLKLRVLDLWAYRRMGSLRWLREEVRHGEELYRLVRDTRALHVVEIRPEPSFTGAFLASAIPGDGKVITMLTNGSKEDPYDFVPKSFKGHWYIRRAVSGDSLEDVPEDSADVVIIEGPVKKWYDEAWRVVRVGGVVSVDGRTWTVHTKAEGSGI